MRHSSGPYIWITLCSLRTTPFPDIIPLSVIVAVAFYVTWNQSIQHPTPPRFTQKNWQKTQTFWTQVPLHSVVVVVSRKNLLITIIIGCARFFSFFRLLLWLLDGLVSRQDLPWLGIVSTSFHFTSPTQILQVVLFFRHWHYSIAHIVRASSEKPISHVLFPREKASNFFAAVLISSHTERTTSSGWTFQFQQQQQRVSGGSIEAKVLYSQSVTQSRRVNL